VYWLWRTLLVAGWIGIAAAAPGLEDQPVTIIDFAHESAVWPSIDDVVMGGVSSSEMVSEDGFASFRGEVSFDNNGGFASVRSRPQVRDLSSFDGLALRVRGDGKTYGFRIRTNSSFDGVSYQVAISPPAGEWHDVKVAFTDFVPVYRGRRVAGHPPLDAAQVTTLGLIISRQEGPFRLDIASIEGYRLRGAGLSNESPS
jgi:NADH dehydrogenase [ubiquinone] 1 alpha subcomplex assembly factor 1